MRGLWVRLPPLALSERVFTRLSRFLPLRVCAAPLAFCGSFASMIQAAATDIRDIVVSNNSFGPREISALMQAVGEDYQQFSVLRDAVAELETREDRTPAAAVRLGVCQYVLGRYRQAIETLRSADGGALAHFYIGKSQFSLSHYPEAIKSYAAAKT